MTVLGLTRFPQRIPSLTVDCTRVHLVYVLDPAEIRKLVEDLASRGWLGPGMLDRMETTLKTELHRLAEEALAEVAQRLGCPEASREVFLGSPREAERVYPSLRWIR